MATDDGGVALVMIEYEVPTVNWSYAVVWFALGGDADRTMLQQLMTPSRWECVAPWRRQRQLPDVWRVIRHRWHCAATNCLPVRRCRTVVYAGRDVIIKFVGSYCRVLLLSGPFLFSESERETVFYQLSPLTLHGYARSKFCYVTHTPF